MKKQVVIIHGGDTFDTYKEYLAYLKSVRLDFIQPKKRGWKDTLGEKLGRRFDVVAPKMPSKLNAKYLEWKIWFERFVPYLKDGVVLIGHSLGGVFLVKYLSENKFKKKIKATFLIAVPYDDKNSKNSLASFKLLQKLSGFEKQAGEIHLFYSQNDPYVPISNL